ncbi:hypothetical protein C7H84_19190 [Burkholderia sp. Nafp2/4-1b]|uniref:hypothetical protein n=1 Tax=Burkholderia sp. Nafp2/4-1b TaxID=2116686 RepID=UPI000F2B203A|nr:hypothetical protein [Burkholderia sp. Nafp2/4-1b]RKU01840.1 hypothetical protein C7H84_19190 [Burkholderia sp. Nafp2/4-1b]
MHETGKHCIHQEANIFIAARVSPLPVTSLLSQYSGKVESHSMFTIDRVRSGTQSVATQAPEVDARTRALHDVDALRPVYNQHPPSKAVLDDIAANPALERLELDGKALDTELRHPRGEVIHRWSSWESDPACDNAIRELVSKAYEGNQLFRRLVNHRLDGLLHGTQDGNAVRPRPILVPGDGYGNGMSVNGAGEVRNVLWLMHDGRRDLLLPADGSSVERAIIQTLVQDLTGLDRDHQAVQQYTNLICAGEPLLESPVDYQKSTRHVVPVSGHVMIDGAQYEPMYQVAAPGVPDNNREFALRHEFTSLHPACETPEIIEFITSHDGREPGAPGVLEWEPVGTGPDAGGFLNMEPPHLNVAASITGIENPHAATDTRVWTAADDAAWMAAPYEADPFHGQFPTRWPEDNAANSRRTTWPTADIVPAHSFRAYDQNRESSNMPAAVSLRSSVPVVDLIGHAQQMMAGGAAPLAADPPVDSERLPFAAVALGGLKSILRQELERVPHRHVSDRVRQQLVNWGYTDNQIRLIDASLAEGDGLEAVRRYHFILSGQGYTCPQIAELAALKEAPQICHVIRWFAPLLIAHLQPVAGSVRGVGLSGDEVVAIARELKTPAALETWIQSVLQPARVDAPESRRSSTVAWVALPVPPWSPALDTLLALEYPRNLLSKLGQRRSHAEVFEVLLQYHPKFMELEYSPYQVATMACGNTRATYIYSAIQHHDALMEMGYRHADVTQLASFDANFTLTSIVNHHAALSNPPTYRPKPGLGLTIDQIVTIAARRHGYQTVDSLVRYSNALRGLQFPAHIIEQLSTLPDCNDRIRIAAELPHDIPHTDIIREVTARLERERTLSNLLVPFSP